MFIELTKIQIKVKKQVLRATLTVSFILNEVQGKPCNIDLNAYKLNYLQFISYEFNSYPDLKKISYHANYIFIDVNDETQTNWK